MILLSSERRIVPFATHAAATIEMASMEEEYDVIVIDEIQMICDGNRGFGWTKAYVVTFLVRSCPFRTEANLTRVSA